MGQIYGAEPYLCHLWGRAPPVPSMGQIYGANLWGTASPVKSMGQSLLSYHLGSGSMGQSPPSEIYGADLWGRAIPVPSMGQIYGAEPHLCHL